MSAVGCSSGSGGDGPQGTGGSTGTAGSGGGAGVGTGGTTGSGGTTGTSGTTGHGGATGTAGTTGAGGAGVSGTAGSGSGGSGGDAPIILSLVTNVTTLMPDGTLVVTAVVTHPQGIAQIIGGTLNDPSGASYGAFMVSTTSGSYSFTLTWAALEMLQAVNTAAGGGSRSFVATFYDQAGHSTSRTFNIQLQCPTPTDAICAGACDSLHVDAKNCGTCGRDCGTTFSLSPANCSSQAKCSGTVTSTVMQTCNAVCQFQNLTCAGTSMSGFKTRAGTTPRPRTSTVSPFPPAKAPATRTIRSRRSSAAAPSDRDPVNGKVDPDDVLADFQYIAERGR